MNFKVVSNLLCFHIFYSPVVFTWAIFMSYLVCFLTRRFFGFQVRATEDVAAHTEVLRGGEEREGPGGGARQKGTAVQATGNSNIEIVIFFN